MLSKLVIFISFVTLFTIQVHNSVGAGTQTPNLSGLKELMILLEKGMPSFLLDTGNKDLIVGQLLEVAPLIEELLQEGPTVNVSLLNDVISRLVVIGGEAFRFINYEESVLKTARVLSSAAIKALAELKKSQKV